MNNIAYLNLWESGAYILFLPGTIGYYKLRPTSTVLDGTSQIQIYLLVSGLRKTAHGSAAIGICHPGNHCQPYA